MWWWCTICDMAIVKDFKRRAMVKTAEQVMLAPSRWLLRSPNVLWCFSVITFMSDGTNFARTWRRRSCLWRYSTRFTTVAIRRRSSTLARKRSGFSVHQQITLPSGTKIWWMSFKDCGSSDRNMTLHAYGIHNTSFLWFILSSLLKIIKGNRREMFSFKLKVLFTVWYWRLKSAE